MSFVVAIAMYIPFFSSMLEASCCGDAATTMRITDLFSRVNQSLLVCSLASDDSKSHHNYCLVIWYVVVRPTRLLIVCGEQSPPHSGEVSNATPYLHSKELGDRSMVAQSRLKLSFGS